MASSRLAKLSRPKLHGACARPRLFARIDQALADGAVWMTGAAGCGKTTLAASYVQARDRSCVWYQFDEDDSEPASFLHYLRQASPRPRRESPPVESAAQDNLATMARASFRDFYAHLPSNALIVFDGYHRLSLDSRTHEVFQFAFSELPNELSLMVISREPPPGSLSRAHLYGHITEIGWSELRLDPDETFVIVRTRGLTDRAKSDQLHARCKGWVAGVTLMLEHVGYGAATRTDPSALTFDFFAAEIFDREDLATQHLLLSTCMVSTVSAQQAAELSADERAPQRLTALARRGLFTEDLGGRTYQYHELFREFLHARLRQIWSAPQVRAHWSRAAALMESSGAAHEAIRLRLEGQEWYVASRTILKNAPPLLAQGRTQAVRDWIHQLPRGLVESSPRLLYTLGSAQIALSPMQARATLERAHAGFVVQQDDVGQAVVAAAIIESIYFEYASYIGLERWTDALLATLQRAPAFPTPEVELRVYSSLQIGFTYRQPTHAVLPRCAERIVDLISRPLEVNQRVISAGMLLNHYVWYAPDKAPDLIREIRPLLKSASLTTFNHLWWLVSEAHHLHYAGEVDAMRALIGDASRLAVQIDEQSASRLLGLLGLVEAVGSGDVATAQTQIESLRMNLDPRRRQEGLIYTAMACQHAVFRGDWQQALESGRHAESEARATGIVNCEYDGLMTQAIALAHLGRPRDADAALRAARALGMESVSEKLRFQNLLIETFVALPAAAAATDVHRPASLDRSVLEPLAAALALGRQRGYMRTFLWTPSLMSNLCEVALENGIEVEYVRRLIYRRGLTPTRGDSDVWPWPLRIRTLGTFAIHKDGAPITFAKKAQQRSLHLLQAIASRPHLEANASALAQELWPDADGDAAAKALSMALHRLRTLLCYEKAVVLIEGKVSLDQSLCWVDAHAFSQRIARWDSNPARSGRHDGEAALRLYGGHFLAEEDIDAPGLAARERLRRQWHRLVLSLADEYAQRADGAAACRLYEQAIETDPSHEVFHRRLIALHCRMGQEDEARHAYERCQSALRAALGRSASFTLEACKATSTTH